MEDKEKSFFKMELHSYVYEGYIFKRYSYWNLYI